MGKTVTTLAELEEEAQDFVNSLVPDAQGAVLVTLSGELGAGKTAFTKAVARSLGVADMVNSPTFVLEKIYALPEGKLFKSLIHIDAYRLDEGSDLIPLGFDECMKDSGNLVLLEWPEKVEGALPVPQKKLSFSVEPNGSRILSYG